MALCPGVLITDIDLGSALNGFDRLRLPPPSLARYIIILISGSSEPYRAEARSRDKFLRKPFSIERLSALNQGILARSQRDFHLSTCPNLAGHLCTKTDCSFSCADKEAASVWLPASSTNALPGLMPRRHCRTVGQRSVGRSNENG